MTAKDLPTPGDEQILSFGLKLRQIAKDLRATTGERDSAVYRAAYAHAAGLIDASADEHLEAYHTIAADHPAFEIDAKIAALVDVLTRPSE